MKGKLIVIEGSDGSGKSTQLELLKAYFESQGLSYKTYKFPNYKSFFGRMIARWLRGEYGDLQSTNPYLISELYAQDRKLMKWKFERWMREGKTILLDRYATSNQAHQCGRLPKSEREKFLRWDIKLEYKINKIPREDIVIYLHVPHETSIKLMQNADRGGRTYTKGTHTDMVEKDVQYLKNAEATYNWLAGKFDHWVKIECADAKGKMRSRDAIHTDIKNALAKRSVIPVQ